MSKCRNIFFSSLLFFSWVDLQETNSQPFEDVQEFRSNLRGQILHAVSGGDLPRGIELYQLLKQTTQEDDFALLQQMGLLVVQQGLKSSDVDSQLCALFAAGMSQDPQFLPLLEKFLTSAAPDLQLVATQTLASMDDDEADLALKKSLASPYLIVRLQAAYALAKKRHAMAYGQIEALLHKVDIRLRPIFAALFVLEASPLSNAVLRNFLQDPNPLVRLETIANLAFYDRDDFLPELRVLLSQVDTSQKEACVFALGHLRDTKSVDNIQKLTDHSDENVRLAAHYALYRLGYEDKGLFLLQAAEKGSLFALCLLDKVNGGENLLLKLLQTTQDRNIRLNAALTLLKMGSVGCEKDLMDILATSSKEWSLKLVTSQGLALHCFKWQPLCGDKQQAAVAVEVTNLYKESFLQEAASLPKECFFRIAQKLFSINCRPLIPTVVHIVASYGCDDAIAFLKKFSLHPGAPLLRGYCLLGLHQIAPCQETIQQLSQLALSLKHATLIRFRPLVPWKASGKSCANEWSGYHLTPEEESRLFIDALLALIAEKEPACMDILLQILKEGNPKNRYALSGLLIRAAE